MSVEIEVDRERCVGAGLCAMLVPDVFDQSDDDGKVLLTDAAPGAGTAGAVRSAAWRCPAAAITLHEKEKARQERA